MSLQSTDYTDAPVSNQNGTMKFINAAVISFVLTISAWKCGQANAAPTGFWDNDIRNPDPQNVFSDDKRNQFFEVKSVFTSNKVEFDNKQSAKDLDQDSVASDGGVFRDVRNQKTVYGDIKAQAGVHINTSQFVDPLKPHSHKPTGFWSRVFGPEKIGDKFNGEVNQKISYEKPIISDGPVLITSNQSS